MSDKITLGNLAVRCRFPIITLQECRIRSKCGEHSEAEIICTVKGDEARAVIARTAESALEIVNREQDGREEILFSGMIRRMELEEEGNYAVLRIWAVSNTWKMDIERKSRSFQNLSRTYKEVAETVLGDYQGTLVWNLPDKQLEHPLIQYKETDYCFLKRILSYLGVCMTAEDSKAGITIHVGMRRGIHKGELDIDGYTYSVIRKDRRCSEKTVMEAQPAGYELHIMDFVRTGDVLPIRGREFQVMEAESDFIHSALDCTCRVFPRQCFRQERIPAETLKGAVLAGEILEAGQELVKMHLDIDKEQPADKAFPFQWKPITGNLFYGMPEAGTKAALYFGSACEDSASVIYNIRENGEECGELADHHNRYLTTKNDKRMYLKPSEMGLLNMTGHNAEIALKDDSLVQVKTEHQISLLAEGRVEMKGRNVTITAPKEATLVRKDMLSPTVINLCNAFDAIGMNGNFAATAPIAEKKRRTPGTETEEERYKLDGAAMSAVLSNIPTDAGGDLVMDRIAGSMPVIIGG